MLKILYQGLLILVLLFSISAAEDGYSHCNCDIDSFWNTETILYYQRVGDFLIAAAYLSIPLELLFFVTCSNLFPFKWIVFQFGAFIILCGLTHLLNMFTYGPHSFLLMLSLTVSKFFTALVSFATAIALLTLIPQLLRVKVRENFLRLKARELDREVGMMKKQEETSWHARVLTQEIRKSLDRHTILYTTMVELSNTLGLQNCAVWMPDENKRVMNLTHELRKRSSSDVYTNSIPADDPEVAEIKESNGVKILNDNSVLGSASSGGFERGPVAAIRMPMLKVSNFKCGTPQIVEASYCILVLVLPVDGSRSWCHQELQIVEVVAGQVAVALSHAAVLEESQLMRKKLAEQNRVLLQAEQSTTRTSEARNKFQVALGQGMRRSIYSILGLLSMLQQEKLSPEQRLIVDAMAKNGDVVLTLIKDVTEITTRNSDRLSLVMRPFNIHLMIKEAIATARCLCDSRGFDFEFQIETTVSDRVYGDEVRLFQIISHMLGTMLNGYVKGLLVFRILMYDEVIEGLHEWMLWKSNFFGRHACVRFEIAIGRSQNDSSNLSVSESNSLHLETNLSFRMCKRLVQMMQGNIWAVPNSGRAIESITLLLQFPLHQNNPVSEALESVESTSATSTPSFNGLRVLLADNDDINRAVTRKILEKLGCRVTSVASGAQCLSSFGKPGTPFQLILLDLHIPQIDGFEVAARIRSFRSGSWPAIVALTASAEDEVWERCLQSGMNGLIHKPVTLHAMEEELFKVLQNT